MGESIVLVYTLEPVEALILCWHNFKVNAHD